MNTLRFHLSCFHLHLRLLLGCVLLGLLPATHAAASVSAEASVRSSSMQMGQTNSYTITIRHARNVPDLGAPQVRGLYFSPTASTQTSHTIINNQASSETRLTWNFQAERPGTYTIPARQFRLGDQTIRIDAVTVEVREMSAEMRERFFLRWSVPDKPFYVGESIPATLQLYVRGDLNASLARNPEGSSDQFILRPFEGQPRQRQGRMNNEPFTVVEWDTVITPIRSGPAALPVSLVLAYNTGQVTRDFFGARPVQETIRLTTENSDWEIRDLPRANRPAGFSGAVGSFEVSGRLSATEAEVGDPITLVLELSGEGNFERIQPPEIPETDGWRIFPPRTRMTEKEASYRGVKTFEYILTPTRDTVTEVPAVAFSWFDPHREVWEERSLGSKPVRIRPDSGGGTSRPATAATGTARDSRSPIPDSLLQVAPLAATAGRPGSLTLPWRQPTFWMVNGGIAILAAIALGGVVRQRKRDRDPLARIRLEQNQRARALAQSALAAANRGEASKFYAAATGSIRHHLADPVPGRTKPESLGWDEIESRLRRCGTDDEAVTRARILFDRQDAAHFAGWTASAEDLDRDCTAFAALLDQIKRAKS